MDLELEASVETTDEEIITIERENFRKLHDAVKLIVDSECSDCTVDEGFIRQATNDRQSIVEINLTSILPDLSIAFSNAKQKVGLMRTILNVDESVKLDDPNVYIETAEKQYKLTDQRWGFDLSKPIHELLDNKFMPYDKFQHQVKIDEDDLILSTDLDPDIIRGVQSICELFQTQMVSFVLEGDSADIRMSEQSKSNSGKIKSDISLNVTDMPKSQFRMSSLPFRMDLNSSMQINVYKQDVDKCLAKCDLELDGSIPVSVYMQVKLVEIK
jgi:hypothetical protein